VAAVVGVFAYGTRQACREQITRGHLALPSLGHFVNRWTIPDLLKRVAIGVTSSTITGAMYTPLARRNNILRILLGMKPQAFDTPNEQQAEGGWACDKDTPGGFPRPREERDRPSGDCGASRGFW
jgi:hypothetical protein